MKQKYLYIVLSALIGLFLTTSCQKEDEAPIEVSFEKITANGSDEQGSTSKLSLRLNKWIYNLDVENIILDAAQTGATKERLDCIEEEGGIYELILTGIKANGKVTVSIKRDGYYFTPNSKEVTVLYVADVIRNKELIQAIQYQTGFYFHKDTEENVVVGYPKNKNFITYADALNLQEKGLSSLADIKYFTNLESLYCNGNNLTTTHDISKLPLLKNLECHENKLTDFDTSTLTGLINLNCSKNELTTLDMSALTNLQSLHCSNNQLQTLYFSSGQEYLLVLCCNGNQLTSLDVSALTYLTQFDCSENKLTALDMSKQSRLQWFDCSKNKLTTLDASALAHLEDMNCSNNQLTTLNISKLIELEQLNCSYNKLTTLDLSDVGELNKFDCSNNKLSTLDITLFKNFNFDFKFGSQTNDNNLPQILTLWVTAEQKAKIDSDKNRWMSLNRNVKLQVK